MDGVMDFLREALPVTVVVVLCAAALFGAHRLLLSNVDDRAPGARLPRQLMLMLLIAVALVSVIIALPVAEGTRNQLLALLGLALTAVVTLSSTTFVANAMAGLMLRSMENIRPGDFVRVGEHFGRVTEQGLFHTEIQTEDRELTTMPNMYLVTNPVTVVRSSGTIISATLSLGYDVAHARVTPVLLEAAKESGLQEPFAQVLELDNHAVSYRIAGFLPDVKHLLTARSNLRRHVLDALHGAGIEIMSPVIMNQRTVPAGTRFIPRPMRAAKKTAEKATAPEDIVFDKAQAAEELELLRQARRGLVDQVDDLKRQLRDADEAQLTRLERMIAQHQAQVEAIEQTLEIKNPRNR